MNTNKRTDEIMNSLEGMRRAEAPPLLWSKVRHRLKPAPTAFRGAWRLALALTVFILVNLVTINHMRQTQSPAGGSQAVANEYAISLPQTY